VHLVFFRHITTGPDNTNNALALALAFGVLIVLEPRHTGHSPCRKDEAPGSTRRKAGELRLYVLIGSRKGEIVPWYVPGCDG
jgi:hypothetical protein